MLINLYGEDIAHMPLLLPLKRTEGLNMEFKLLKIWNKSLLIDGFFECGGWG